MSLKQFLAVGRSFAGSPREKSPFEMRKDVRLPTFENAPRFAARPAHPVQTDWLEEKEHQPAIPEPLHNPKSNLIEAEKMESRKRSWLEVLSFGYLGNRKRGGELVQTEMNLEKVRVIRNDLIDSDLEVVVKKNKAFALRKVKAQAAAAPATAVPKSEDAVEPKPARQKTSRPEWNELTARLFEIGQH